jgi:hypothetical protein
MPCTNRRRHSRPLQEERRRGGSNYRVIAEHTGVQASWHARVGRHPKAKCLALGSSRQAVASRVSPGSTGPRCRRRARRAWRCGSTGRASGSVMAPGEHTEDEGPDDDALACWNDEALNRCRAAASVELSREGAEAVAARVRPRLGVGDVPEEQSSARLQPGRAMSVRLHAGRELDIGSLGASPDVRTTRRSFCPKRPRAIRLVSPTSAALRRASSPQGPRNDTGHGPIDSVPQSQWHDRCETG